jgi:hypothetical protein
VTYIKVVISRDEKELVCDFCSARPVYASHAAYDFIVPWTKQTEFVHESKGGWAACQACDALIEAEDWKGLAQRSAEQFFAHFPAPTQMMSFKRFKQEMYELHQIFRRSRIRAA